MSGTVGTRREAVFDRYGFQFDGSNEYFNSGTIFSELDGGTQFTLSMWLKPTDLISNRIIFHIPRNTTQTNSQVLVWLRTSGQLDISVNVNTQFCRSTTGAITAGVWQHLLIAFDLSQAANDRIRPFVNGVDVFSVANNPVTSFPTSSGAIYLGEEANGYLAPFLGTMDEVALWVGSNVSSLVNQIYNNGIPTNLNKLSTLPSHWWRMGDGDTYSSGWNLNDNIGSYDLSSNNMDENNRIEVYVPLTE